MSVFVENLKKNSKISVASAVALFGAILNFIAVCIRQSLYTTNSDTINPVGLDWYAMFFYFVTIGILLSVSATDSMHRYKLACLALVSIALAYLPGQINSRLSESKASSTSVVFTGNGFQSSTDNKLSTSGSLATAGLIMIVLPFFAILGWLGSHEEAPVNNILKIVTVSSKETVHEPEKESVSV